MHHHLQLCKPALAGINNDDDNQEEESNTDDNGKDDFVQLGLPPPIELPLPGNQDVVTVLLLLFMPGQASFASHWHSSLFHH